MSFFNSKELKTNSVKIYPNYCDEKTTSRYVNLVLASNTEPVPDSHAHNVRTLKNPKIAIPRNISKLGKLTFVETLLYNQGSHSPDHIDSGGGNDSIKWLATAILFCNYNYTGGELEFPILGLSLKPYAGTLIIFPAGPDSTDFVHHVNPVLLGTRITTVYRFRR